MKKRSKKKLFLTTLNLLALSFYSQVATTSVNINTVINPKSSLLMGITMDSRSGMMGYSNTPCGYYNVDTTGTLIPAIQPLFYDFPMSTLRYPGNAISFAFDWKTIVGHPAYQRPTVNVLGAVGPPQSVKFGFDEFMKMTYTLGVNPQDIQIMVPIYKIGTPGLTPTQTLAAITDPLRWNADWVEYANASVGTNPGGGTNWAAVRAANGHSAPYGIKIWNLGNEPWAAAEYSFNATNYLSTIAPIVDSMLAMDPTIKLTLPSVGSASSTWNAAILGSTLVSSGKIYGLSPHFFPDEITPPNPPSNGVQSRETALANLTASAQAKGLKIIVGDHAHGIISPMPPDLAMQWQGANLTADFLLMISQLNNIERANFWIYGIPKSTWHPIRQNSPGNFSLLAVAALYKKMFPLVLDKSVKVTNTSPPASDLNPYAVRSGAFALNDNSKLNVISVNRDKNNTVPLTVNGISGYSLTTTSILTATSLAADSYTENVAVTDGNGDYIMPPMSVLILQYTIISTGIKEADLKNQSILIYPNPANSQVTIKSTRLFKHSDKIILYNSLGEVIQKIAGSDSNEIIIETNSLSDGIYSVKIEGINKSQTGKIVILKN